MTVVCVNFERQEVRATHRRLIMSEVLLNGPLSRTEIARRTGLRAASVSRISRELIEAGLIAEGDSVLKNRPGRRFISLSINGDGGYVLGISVNLFQQYVSLANLNNEIIDRRELGLDSFADVNAVVDAIVAAAQDLLDSNSIDKARVIGGALAVTGAVDPETGTVCVAPLLGWEAVAIGRMLSQPLGLPIHVENLPNTINLAETHFGIARGNLNVAVFNASLGVGVSLMIDNKILRGSRSRVGQIEQLSLWKDAQGRSLRANQVAGGWGVLSMLGEALPRDPSARAVAQTRRLFDVIKQADDGDCACQDALTNAGEALGEIISVVDTILHPQLNILAGPLAQCPYYTGGVSAALEGRSGSASSIRVEASGMTWRAATRWLALHEFMTQRDIDLKQLAGRLVA